MKDVGFCVFQSNAVFQTGQSASEESMYSEFLSASLKPVLAVVGFVVYVLFLGKLIKGWTAQWWKGENQNQNPNPQ